MDMIDFFDRGALPYPDRDCSAEAIRLLTDRKADGKVVVVVEPG